MSEQAPRSTFLKDVWYLASASRRLPRGRAVPVTILGEQVLFLRDRSGRVTALRDACPHRGLPLSEGRFDGVELECRYHGWRFDTEGKCAAIPCLAEGQRDQAADVQVTSYPCREIQGNVWIFMGGAASDLSSPPEIEGLGDRHPVAAGRMVFPCGIDDAVISLIDPGHVPFLHGSPLWRDRRRLKEKQRRFAASPMGFTLLQHTPEKNSWILHALCGRPQFEMQFQLPGIHIERLAGKRGLLSLLLAMTPVSEQRTEFHYCLYGTMPWLKPLRPLAQFLLGVVFGQDRDILGTLAAARAGDPRQRLLGDPDAQARWYLQLKNEHASARREQRPFENPVPAETVLHWRT